MVAWKGLNLRPADYESGGLVVLMGETWRILRGLSMQISPSCSIRAYPEIHLWFINEIEPEPMASNFLKANPGKELWQTEPDPNPNFSRKFLKIHFWPESPDLDSTGWSFDLSDGECRLTDCEVNRSMQFISLPDTTKPPFMGIATWAHIHHKSDCSGLIAPDWEKAPQSSLFAD